MLGTEATRGAGDEGHARPSHRATVVRRGPRVCDSVGDGSGEGPLGGRQPGRLRASSRT